MYEFYKDSDFRYLRRYDKSSFSFQELYQRFESQLIKCSRRSFFCYVNNNLRSYWISVLGNNIYRPEQRCSAKSKRLFSFPMNRISAGVRYIVNAFISSSFPKTKTFRFKAGITSIVAGGLINLSPSLRESKEWTRKNRREPIKSSFRLPVLWNRFFISHFTFSDTKNTSEKWYTRPERDYATDFYHWAGLQAI